MAEVDSLSIQISAEANDATSSLNSLIKSLDNVSKKISSINSLKLNLNFSVSGGATKEVNNLEAYVSKAAKNMSKNLQDAFNIPSSNMSRIKELSTEFANLTASGDSSAFNKIDELTEEMTKTASAAQEADERMKDFYETVKSISKIYINPVDMDTDSWKDMDGLLRQKFTSQASSGAIPLDSLMQEWKDQYSDLFSGFDTDTVQGQFEALTKVVKQCREEIERPISTQDSDFTGGVAEKTVEEIRKTYDSITKVKEALETLGTTTTTQNTGFDSLVKSLKSLTSLDTEKIVSVSEAVSKAFSGLESLNGVKLDLTSLEQLTEISKQLNKVPDVNTDNIAKMGTALEAVSTSMTSISGIGSVDKTITNLVNALGRLASANMSNFNTGSLQGIVSAVQSISALPDVSSSINRLVSSLARLASSGQSITTVTAELPSLGNALGSVISRLSSLGAVDSSILSFSSAISQLASSGSKIGTVVSSLGALGDELVSLISKLSAAPTISANITQLTSSLASLASQGSSVGTATTAISSGLNTFSTTANTAKKSATSLAAAFGKLYGAIFLFKGVFSAISNAISVASDLTEVQNVVDTAFAEYSDVMEEFTETSITEYGIDELTAKTIGSRYQAMANAVGLTNDAAAEANTALSDVTNGYIEAGGSVADMSVNMTKLAADMASFYNLDAEDVAEDLESIFTGTVKPLRQYGLDLTEATLQEWAMKNGLDSDISSMSQAEKILLRYQYVLANTTDAQGDFARTSDKLLCVA